MTSKVRGDDMNTETKDKTRLYADESMEEMLATAMERLKESANSNDHEAEKNAREAVNTIVKAMKVKHSIASLVQKDKELELTARELDIKEDEMLQRKAEFEYKVNVSDPNMIAFKKMELGMNSRLLELVEQGKSTMTEYASVLEAQSEAPRLIEAKVSSKE